MSGRIPREFIDELLVRVDIVDLIDSHVPLKKTGANYVARCPFHTEKSPSFSVNRNKQFYHCFGCGASGNAIGFLMNFNHLDFVEAVEDLAGFVGIEVPRETKSYPAQPKKEDLSSLYLLMEQVAEFYAQQLRTTPAGKIAADYLKKRGVDGDCASTYKLGYAPEGWQVLSNHFRPTQLMEAGLLTSKDGGQAYDRFRNRIIFPIRDKRGRTIALGGRVLDDSQPKYLNSPETPLFHKGKEVYGLYELLQKQAKPSRILIVEGYMDVIALAQQGLHYAVAALGTALSQAHLDLLFRFSSELVFCFDGDKAGQEAAWRAMDAAFSSLKEGRSCRIMLLPPSHDPDSLVREEGLEQFTLRLDSALALSDYFFAHIAENLNLAETEGRARLIGKAKPYLEKLPDGVFKEMMFARLKDLTGATALKALAPASAPAIPKRPPPQDSNRLSSARTAIALLLQNPELADEVEAKDIDWQGLNFRGIELFKTLLQVILTKQSAIKVTTAVLLEHFRNTPEEKAIYTLALLDLAIATDKIATVFNDALDGLLKQALENGIAELLKIAQSKGLDNQQQETLRKLLANK